VVEKPDEMPLPWTQAAWRAEAEHWIRERVDALGDAITKLEQPHVRPWGTVFRVETDAGLLWCKAPIDPLAYEAPLLEELGARRPDAVPRLLASDPPRGWMLLEDAGTQLPDLHPGAVPVELWEQFLPTYAQLQLDAAPAADALIAAGVPDRRSHRLLDGYLRVLDDDRLVRPPAEPLDDEELARLRALVPTLVDAIDAVAALGLPDTIHHDDLHAWNVCVADGRYRFIDWGDASIAQPLLSLYVPLVRVPEEGVDRARDAYLEPWTALSPRADLVSACHAALLLAQLTGTLKWELITSFLSDEERGDYANVIPERLRYLLELACA
jgi:aminoglycoside/choline kinase family phosphotransferase